MRLLEYDERSKRPSGKAFGGKKMNAEVKFRGKGKKTMDVELKLKEE